MRPATVTAVLSPFERSGHGIDARDSQAKLEEAVGLARAIDLDVRLAETVSLRRVSPATLIGKGTVERIKEAERRRSERGRWVVYHLVREI